MTAPDGRHAIVTGGSSGLGRSIAALMAARGYQVSLIARDPAQLKAAASSMPGQVKSQIADVTDSIELTRAVAHLVERFGPCDVLVATAGAARPGYFLELDSDVFRSQMELNYFGALNAVRAVAPSMVERRTASIVAIASTAALGRRGHRTHVVVVRRRAATSKDQQPECSGRGDELELPAGHADRSLLMVSGGTGGRRRGLCPGQSGRG